MPTYQNWELDPSDSESLFVSDINHDYGAAERSVDNVAPAEAWCQELEMMRKDLQSNFEMLMDRLDHLCAAKSVATTQVAAAVATTTTATGQDTGTQTHCQDGPVPSLWAKEVIVRGQKVVVKGGVAWKYVPPAKEVIARGQKKVVVDDGAGAWPYVAVVIFLTAILWSLWMISRLISRLD
ncbi:hypothetical protein MY11210_000717 [Beauveria gryllotalpidicola]